MLPSITIINNASTAIQHAQVTLPNSGLDFGVVQKGSDNTIYYSLAQLDGTYRYQFKLANGREFSGECGYVTGNELHKRVVITVRENGVICDERH